MNNTILVVEDSPVQATLLRRMLTQQGFTVTIAKHGQDALSQLAQQSFILVISDIEMPLMNGYQLCRAIKRDSRLCHIPVILLTTLSEPSDLMEGLNAGADSFITKPYDDEVLLSRVNFLLTVEDAPSQDSEISVLFAGSQYRISATRQHILNLLLSTYENAKGQNVALTTAQMELKRLNQEIEQRRQESERLLLNILPKTVADELKITGISQPVKFNDVSVLFTDFVGFTSIAERLSPQELLKELEIYFNYFDSIIEQHRLEKIKTIGDSYMVAGGVPEPNETHATDCVLAALAMQQFVEQRYQELTAQGRSCWRMRVGVHTGPAVAGVIGKKKFAYDLWGDTVNLASRMESTGEAGKVNISDTTYERVNKMFHIESRGKLKVKHKDDLNMYFVLRNKTELEASVR